MVTTVLFTQEVLLSNGDLMVTVDTPLEASSAPYKCSVHFRDNTTLRYQSYQLSTLQGKDLVLQWNLC